METFSEVQSLGPCSEEAEAALTDEVMLSLWYGGLNRIYVQKFRGEGRWIFCPASSTPKDFLRAWASDNPHMRAFAYYCKAVWPFLCAASGALFLGNWSTVNFMNDIKHRSVQDSLGPFLYVLIVVFIILGVPIFMLSCDVYGKWIKCYRALNCALEQGDDPDLSDRARMAEMRRTVLGWGVNSGYVRYDRDRGVWQLNAQKGRIIG